jgi:hypothetical protein
MGSDPETTVLDADHQAWEVPSVFIGDGSVTPTQGSANPPLTIMALASRLSDGLAPKRPAGEQRGSGATRGGSHQSRLVAVAAEPGLLAAPVGPVVEDPVRAIVVVVVDRPEQVLPPRYRRAARAAGALLRRQA